MPTTFSTALPAIATITSPVNACERPSVVIAGSNAETNQSETKAAPRPATTRTSAASQVGQRGNHTRRLGGKALCAVPQPANQKRQTEHQQAVRENGADERGLHDSN